MAERHDLRSTHFIFSIDPKGSEDIDDALSLRRTPHGTLELGVHIADVSAFVAPGSLVDVEARARYGQHAIACAGSVLAVHVHRYVKPGSVLL